MAVEQGVYSALLLLATGNWRTSAVLGTFYLFVWRKSKLHKGPSCAVVLRVNGTLADLRLRHSRNSHKNFNIPHPRLSQ